MKKYLFIALAAFSFITLSQSCKKKMKDEDIQKAATEKIAGMSDIKGGAVMVKDGVATLTGECKDEACKAKCGEEIGKVKGVKSVTNNATITPVAPPAPVPAAGDEAIKTAAAPWLKDNKGAAVEVSNGVATVTGVADAPKRAALKQVLTAAGAKNVVFK